MAELLGTSLKAIHSYEQGWRAIPAYIERQVFFLVSRLSGKEKGTKPCWKVKKCSATQKARCPAWEFCDGTVQKNWKEKMKICRSCEVFSYIL